MVMKIDVFEGEYAFLSNFYKAQVEFEGIIYPTNEHAFQAAKSLKYDVRQSILTTCSTPEQAKQWGQQISLRPDWEIVKVDIMTIIVRNKFMANKDLQEKLLATDDMVLLWGNTIHDDFWGFDLTIGDGLNRLGLILMTVRTELKALAGLMVNKIDIFEGAYFFLSNYYEVSVYFDGVTYPSSEHAYQAAKSLDSTVRLSFIEECQTPDQAKKKGRQIEARSDWEDVKVEVMTTIFRNKFMSNVYLSQKLLETGNTTLMEGNTWHDGFWGVDIITGQGLNYLGKVLMVIRDELTSFMTIPATRIDAFEGDYFFLSNFYESDIEFDGIIYPSNDQAFEAAQNTDIVTGHSLLTEYKTLNQFKEKVQQIPLLPDSEKVKLHFMKKIVKNKFLTHPELKKKLLATNDTILIEGNTRNDTFWGVDLTTKKGHNYLGLILMELRTNLRVQGEERERKSNEIR